MPQCICIVSRETSGIWIVGAWRVAAPTQAPANWMAPRGDDARAGPGLLVLPCSKDGEGTNGDDDEAAGGGCRCSVADGARGRPGHAVHEEAHLAGDHEAGLGPVLAPGPAG